MTFAHSRQLIVAALTATLTVFAAPSFAQNSSVPTPDLRAQHLSQRADRLATTPDQEKLFDTPVQAHIQRTGMHRKHRHGDHSPVAPRS